MSDVSVSLIKRLRYALEYDCDSGVILWKTRTPDDFKSCKNPQRECRRWNSRYAGSRAGRIRQEGYIMINLGGFTCGAHRIAWMIHTGRIPNGVIDHINGDPSDNRIKNLRVVDAKGNARNARRRTDNAAGETGVSFHKASGKWRAYINREGAPLHLGLFDTLEGAVSARKVAASIDGYHKNHGRHA